ncbi:MAG: cytochrome-c oxidase, cbb3-type subunit II, partial [Rhodospirillaceae bacterium]|nr:cytochrome-c oxidase, cbb3-type subunit II [Rhodospirillaceae bacterium]
MYDHPFQWGSKRTGPDLARVGGRYSDEWHVAHMIAPRDLVPESVMPGYPFLATTPLDAADIADHLKANQIVGVPYSDEMIATAAADLAVQVDPDSDELEAFEARYPKAQVRNFDGNGEMISELDALIAYLQMLGTLVDFTTYKAEGQNLR